MSKPHLYDYFDYREYLNDTFTYFKETDTTFSHRKFLADADIPGSTYLLRVLRNERKLSPKYISNFCKALHLSTSESAFFTILVKFGNEKNVDKKEALLKELLKVRSEKANHSLDDKKLRYFEKWYYPVLRDLIGLAGKIDYNALGRMLIPPIKGDQVQSALEYLHRNGFIKPRDDG
ncbi:MAG: TIGR02147 family protein, partial [Fibrobacterota bacterium]